MVETNEAALDAKMPIIDPHHHLWDVSPVPDYIDFDVHRFIDTVRQSGHRIIASVHVESQCAFLADGPEHLRGSGETIYACNAATAAAGSGIDVARGIVTNADLRLAPAKLEALLDAHLQISDGRVRGIRHISAWDSEPSLNFESRGLPRGALAQPQIHAALRQVAKRGLSFDAWTHFHQLDDLLALADAVPQLPITVDHLGGVLLVGPYASRADEVFAAWRRHIDALAKRANITMKLGGIFLGPACQFDPASGSAGLEAKCRPWFDHILDHFGANRCMFESNFPVDGAHLDYGTLWNAFKRYARPLSEHERQALFFETANRVYRLGLTSDPFLQSRI
jgi:predicted TIM-barrel fold metal-dependent hydrolase